MKRKGTQKKHKVAENGWKKVDLNDLSIEGFADGCAFELEELTDYTVESNDFGGKILIGADNKSIKTSQGEQTKQKKKQRKRKDKVSNNTRKDNEKNVDIGQNNQNKDDNRQNEGISSVDSKPSGTKHKTESIARINLPHWKKLQLHPLLYQSLHQCGFVRPTPIQEQTIRPAILDHRDIVGAAPTGSGKTLAFGLPILSQLLSQTKEKNESRSCRALIITPTRELAMQIHQHLNAMVPKQEIGLVTLVGGMAIQKQKRLLARAPEIVIGTPGRLWEFMDSEHPHFQNLNSQLQFLVIDEADRVLQTGAYPEVEKIFSLITQRKKDQMHAKTIEEDVQSDTEDMSDLEDQDDGLIMLDDVLKQQKEVEEDDESVSSMQDAQDSPSDTIAPRTSRQTFLFSATLTIPEAGRFRKSGRPNTHQHALTVLEMVMKRVGLRGKPAVIDLGANDENKDQGGAQTTETNDKSKARPNTTLSLPQGLELCQYEVTDATRDSFLYYFLTQYPGRTIVFLNAIHQVRKLSNLLTLLKLPVFALHAEMQQRQRLKKLDGFRANSQGILIATDVAARGLDIPSVEYVVHYHIPRSTEVFLHRSGRTARANKEGLSISLVSPADAQTHAQICKLLLRPTGLSEFPFDHHYLPAVNERVRLAKSLAETDNVRDKKNAELTWFKQMAAACEIDLDENLTAQLDIKKKNKGGDMDGGAKSHALAKKRTQLNRLLAEPIRPVGAVRKFRQIHEEIGTKLNQNGEYRKRIASNDLLEKGKRSYKRFRRR